MKCNITKTRALTGPAFRWPGSKWTLMRRLLSLFPHHTRYVSLFGGSAADILAKPPSRVEIFNDLSDIVFDFFKVLQDDRSRQRLRRLLDYTPYSRRQFSNCLNILNTNQTDPVLRAWALVTCTQCGYGGIDPNIVSPSGFAARKEGPLQQRWLKVSEHIERVSRRLRGVVIENLEWHHILDRYDGVDTLFYADPPYVHGTRTGGDLYQHEMSDSDHVELLQRLQKTKANVILSGYAHSIYDEILAGWRRIEFPVRCSLSRNQAQARRIEVIWMSFDESGKRLNQAEETQTSAAV